MKSACIHSRKKHIRGKNARRALQPISPGAQPSKGSELLGLAAKLTTSLGQRLHGTANGPYGGISNVTLKRDQFSDKRICHKITRQQTRARLAFLFRTFVTKVTLKRDIKYKAYQNDFRSARKLELANRRFAANLVFHFHPPVPPSLCITRRPLYIY
jgi:hypothetical protein